MNKSFLIKLSIIFCFILEKSFHFICFLQNIFYLNSLPFIRVYSEVFLPMCYLQLDQQTFECISYVALIVHCYCIDSIELYIYITLVNLWIFVCCKAVSEWNCYLKLGFRGDYDICFRQMQFAELHHLITNKSLYGLEMPAWDLNRRIHNDIWKSVVFGNNFFCNAGHRPKMHPNTNCELLW